MPTSEELRATATGDIDRTGEIVRSLDGNRAEHRRGVCIGEVQSGRVRLVSTEEKRETANQPGESVLGKAHRLVQGKRGAAYGHPLDNHTTTAQMFGAYLQRKYGLVVPLDADDVCWFNIFQKGSRDANEPTEDNLIDTAGYAFNLELIRGERERRSRTV